MQDTLEKEKYAWGAVMENLPRALALEIEQIGMSRRGFPHGLCEIRLRRDARSSVLFSGESVTLTKRVSGEELEQILQKACDLSLYSCRDTLAEGYLPMAGGVRVGVCGRARYDGGRLVGVSGIGSLVFRFPFSGCEFAGSLCELFRGAHSGLLIYAPPGGGKTTALRDMARILSSGQGAKRVAVVDERLEFFPEDYVGCEVDLLRGYRRSRGVEIAVRTLSPEIIIIDEIGADEVEELSEVVRCGIPIIATAHASNIDELLSKRGISGLIRNGAFDLFAGIVKRDGEYGFVATALPEAALV